MLIALTWVQLLLIMSQKYDTKAMCIHLCDKVKHTDKVKIYLGTMFININVCN